MRCRERDDRGSLVRAEKVGQEGSEDAFDPSVLGAWRVVVSVGAGAWLVGGRWGCLVPSYKCPGGDTDNSS